MVESVNIKSDCETKSKKEQTYSVCLTTVEKYKKVKSINKQNDYKKISKKWTNKKEKHFFCVFCKKD